MRTFPSYSGTAIVEFVVAMPILFVLLFVSAEFGRAFQQQNTLTKSVRDASRFLADRGRFGSTGTVFITPTVAAQARNLVVYGNAAATGTPILPGMDVADVTVAGTNDGEVTVQASYDYQPIFAQIPLLGGGSPIVPNYTFQADMTMRAL